MGASEFFGLSWYFFACWVSTMICTFAYCVTRSDAHPFRDWVAWTVAFVIGASCLGASKYFKMRYMSTPIEIYNCDEHWNYREYEECRKEVKEWKNEQDARRYCC